MGHVKAELVYIILMIGLLKHRLLFYQLNSNLPCNYIILLVSKNLLKPAKVWRVSASISHQMVKFAD